MGARQSKRSVDITTGKEVVVEGGEVAGAGGEGKLERIEDLDALKPQLNGDTAHQDVEISDKEKKMQQEELAENEKDTCNEKEIILSPVNGDNGETPKEATENVEAETNKKNKKEKVKKKWSFRSISFSKKDKQKPAKKEEATNGECEKVPEEVADNPAVVSNETPEIKAEAEAPIKDVPKLEEVENSSDKAPAPETPVTPATEPLSNGSGAPESPKEEIRQNGDAPSVEEKPTPVEAAPEPVPEPESVEAPAVDSLPVNGLKIEDVAEETQAVQENKVEESAPEKMEVKSAESAATEIKSVSEIIDVPAVIDAQPEITDSIVTENSVATE